MHVHSNNVLNIIYPGTALWLAAWYRARLHGSPCSTRTRAMLDSFRGACLLLRPFWMIIPGRLELHPNKMGTLL